MVEVGGEMSRTKPPQYAHVGDVEEEEEEEGDGAGVDTNLPI